MNNLDELLETLRSTRAYHAEQKSETDLLLQAVKETLEYKTYSTNAQDAAKKIEELENQIRAMAIAHYSETGEKKINSMVEVKIFKTFKILDAQKTRDWAFGNLPAALKLDEKKIEKYALEFGDVEGTEKGEEARAQIAQKL